PRRDASQLRAAGSSAARESAASAETSRREKRANGFVSSLKFEVWHTARAPDIVIFLEEGMKRLARILITLGFSTCAAALGAANLPEPLSGDFVIHNFRFISGEQLPELKIHYRTLGEPRRDASGIVRNAVLILHGTAGSGRLFLGPNFAGVLFGPGQLLDSSRYFLILPDRIGPGDSSKPSDGLHARFPRYSYDDMVEAQHRLLVDGLKVNHLRLVMGTSMGGMHSWVWAETFPDFADGFVPLAAA